MTKIHASLKSAAESKDDDSISKSVPTFMVDPRTVVVEEGFNARPLDPEHVAHLKELRRAGVDLGFYTLQMKDGKPTLRDGHHRHAADMELIAEGVDILRVKAIEFKGDEKAAILMMLATGSNKKYEPLQVGEQYAKLVNLYGMTYAEIAKERGMSAQHVKDMIRLTEQPAELKAMINSGEVKGATALKLVKKVGATAATETLRQAATAPGVRVGKPITQKALDNLGKSTIDAAVHNKGECEKHLDAMIESPTLDASTKAAIREVAALVAGQKQCIVPNKRQMLDSVNNFLNTEKNNKHSDVQRAAHLLSDYVNKRPIPDDNSPGARSYGHHVWLQDMAAGSAKPTFRAAAHWFLAVLNADRTGAELAPAPSVLSMEEAMRAEMESGGAVLAETLCPEQAALITWARGRS